MNVRAAFARLTLISAGMLVALAVAVVGARLGGWYAAAMVVGGLLLALLVTLETQAAPARTRPPSRRERERAAGAGE